ncbi:hypothetical protein ACTMU2_30760 [Cupriavidus basilensis]
MVERPDELEIRRYPGAAEMACRPLRRSLAAWRDGEARHGDHVATNQPSPN